MVQKENIDKEILKLLTKDSRMSYREIAKALDVSHVNISSRIKAMEEQGVIKGYTTILDLDALNYYPLCLRISAESGTDLTKIGSRIAEHPEINVVLRVSGDCELLALAVCDDRQNALDLLDQINTIPGIDKAESHIVLETIKLSGKQLKP